jgi:endonuclease YncB( thermonuclease family)
MTTPAPLLSALLIAASAFAVGPASRAIDGDTFEAASGEVVRLWGIDAPERGEAGADAATAALAGLLARGATCQRRGTDRYGRTVARCTGPAGDIACALVAAGHATDWPRYSGGHYASCAP